MRQSALTLGQSEKKGAIMENWLERGAVAQGQALARGEITARALAEAYLDRAGPATGTEGAVYARLTSERALAEADAADSRARAGVRRGILDGVALSWKDNIDSAGTPTEAGTRLLAGRVPAEDADVLQAATAAGLVCLGKTHMTELAFSGLGLNPMTATPPNAYDPALVPGGSSSGAAVSVAKGLAAAAIGTDTGGSIRVPAAWNGLVGFKPTHGVMAMRGIVPLCETFDCVGPIARNVEDCAALYAILRAEAAPDLRGADASGLRLAVLDGVPFEGARPEPVAAFDHSVARLTRAGSHLSRINPSEVAEAMPLAALLFAPEAYGLWRAQIEAAPDAMYPPILDRFRGGAAVTAADYVAAWVRLRQLRAGYAAAVAGWDAVILPTAPNLPPDRARLLSDPAFFAEENLLTLRNTRIANLLGLPAITLPTGAQGCGIMLMGHAGGERALLRVAAAVERALLLDAEGKAR